MPSHEPSTSWPPALDAASRVDESGVAMYHAIEFASVEGFRPLQLDLYLPTAPDATASAPAIVYLHGGGWTVGTRRRFGRAFRGWDPSPLVRLARAGFAVATVDYRLSGEAPFPAAVHDAKAAVRWLRANAGALQIEAERIAAWGESAGGHLALMLGLTGSNTELAGTVGDALDQRSDVCAVVAWYAATNFATLNVQRLPDSEADHEAPDSYESRFLGAPIPARPEVAVSASPLTYVHADAPPIQLHHGLDDRVVPHQQSADLARALEELEVPVELVSLPGTDHFWIGAPDLDAIFTASQRFIEQHTRP